MKLETFLDVLLIEEIPVEDDTATGIVTAGGRQIVRSQKAARKPQTGKVLSCDTRFPWNGVMIEMPYRVGDIVRTNEFGRDYILLNPDDEFRPEATKYYLIHYADVQGRVERAKVTSIAA
jgi:co-chaperonin GroES (HSP10)